MNNFSDKYTGYTKHGHAIDGVPQQVDKKPNVVARCGGPGLCSDCMRDAATQRAAFHQFDVTQADDEPSTGVDFNCPRCQQRMNVQPLISNIGIKVELGKTLLTVRYTPSHIDHDCPTTKIIINK